MNRRSWLICLAAILAGLLVLPTVTLLFIPDAAVHKVVSSLLATRGISMQAERIDTSPPFGISAKKVILADSATALLALDQAAVQLRLLPLLAGKVSVKLSAAAGTGRLSGMITLWPSTRGTVHITNLDLDTIPFLASVTGGTVKGNARIDVVLATTKKQDISGEAKIQIQNIQLTGVRISTLPLPDVSFPELRGLIKIKGQSITIDNLALQGNGIYLRAGGTVSLAVGSPLTLNLELMPSPEFMEQQKMVFLMMTPYQTTPGTYRLPITGTVTSPQLAGR